LFRCLDILKLAHDGVRKVLYFLLAQIFKGQKNNKTSKIGNAKNMCFQYLNEIMIDYERQLDYSQTINNCIHHNGYITHLKQLQYFFHIEYLKKSLLTMNLHKWLQEILSLFLVTRSIRKLFCAISIAKMIEWTWNSELLQ